YADQRYNRLFFLLVKAFQKFSGPAGPRLLPQNPGDIAIPLLGTNRLREGYRGNKPEGTGSRTCGQHADRGLAENDAQGNPIRRDAQATSCGTFVRTDNLSVC